ncbi:uncharacterized protein LOC119834031 [Zerene cesonia]|uniref:uncharacterized protein LOC119834031 n=1 Tax=Zerene cesonia TaxID=33412 RepID=UPI0018E4F760|nr:uncharacterized protein LOC119834031 [Zerene cesonia]
MGCSRQLAPTLLLHVNLLLMVYVGAALVVAARARWDPSLYIPARELFPREFRVAAALLPAAALALLALAHLALLALRTRRLHLRRLLLYVYAAGVSSALVAQTAAGAWVWARVHAWARSDAAHELQRAAALADLLRPLLDHLAHWHPLPDKLNDLIQVCCAIQNVLPVITHVNTGMNRDT